MASGTVLLDPDQILVLAGTHRKDFLRYKRRIAALADELGEMLGQESMFILAFQKSDSFLVFMDLP
jgi:hypothetical protein